MTRETKIGLVVAGSFLTVMGTLIALKLRQTNTPAPEVAKSEVPAPVEVAAANPTAPAPIAPPADLPRNEPAWPAANSPASVAAPIVPPPGQPAVANDPAPAMPAPVNNPAPSLDPAPSSLLPAPTDTPKPVETPAAPVVKEPEMPKPPAQDPAPSLNPEPFKPVDPPKKEEPVVEPPKVPVAKLENRPTITAPRHIPDPTLNVQPTSAPKPIAPVVPPAPANDSYLEEEYRAQAGDTFTAISRKFYHDEKFAAALKQYNRDYPLATPNMRRDPDSALAPGTITWIPPLRILAKRYPGLTPEMPAGPTASATSNGTMTQVSAGPRTYRVTKEGGESLQEIARRTQLPNDDWTMIHRLNPMLNPNQAVPIPKGTLLRLPAEARVEN